MTRSSPVSRFAGRSVPRTSGPRTLLVGTALSVRQLAPALSVVEPAPRLVGCLLPGAAVDAAPVDLPCAVLGTIDQLEDVVRDRADALDQVLVSLPLAMVSRLRELGAMIDRCGVKWRFMPTLADQLAGRTTALAAPHTGEPAIDPVQLLGRRPRALHEATIRACLASRRVMITGAGGSIGSELARLVGRFEPACLLLVERGENALFEIDREIARIYPDLPRRAILHDVTRRAGTMDLCAEHRPDVIFHAAAHKHVPMMEEHPADAVENNFYGTRAIADAADACGAERFVMISTDKAVNPSSVMGATKRLAELYVQDLDARSATAFAAVRFGNVLGSACSVLPIWSKQLGHGGPVTVTHPEMTRYFMTIPEAAGLVLQAGALPLAARRSPVDAEVAPVSASIRDEPSTIGNGAGRVFLLDMGEPVRIVDLARRFVRAHGLEPDVDVPIVFTGIRPGEKLFESLAYDSEDLSATAHESVRIWHTPRPDASQMRRIIDTFDRLRDRGGDPAHPWQGVTRASILGALRSAIPEMVAAAAG